METLIRKQIKQVNSAYSETLDLYGAWAKKCGMSYNALVILYTLDDLKECTQKQICRSWALPKQTVHGILRDFEKRGYIVSCSNRLNKRERLLSFTEDGKEFAAAVLQPLYAIEERAMQHLGAELCRQLVACNAAYFEALKEEIDNG